MMHDPYQTNPTFAAYTALNNPFTSPYATAMQTSAINPAVACNPLAAQQAAQQLGIQGIQGNPYSNYAQQLQQLQLASALAQQATSPFAQAWGQQNPFVTGLQNPLVAQLQNPFVAAALQAQVQQNPFQNPLTSLMANPILAQLQSPYGIQPYAQFQQHHLQHAHGLAGLGGVQGFGGQQQFSPFGQIGSQLAPQSWVGQGVAGQYGQVNPIALQLAARAFQGGNPWGI